MKTKTITFLLILSLLANVYLIQQEPPAGEAAPEEKFQEIQARINSLEKANEGLETKVLQDSLSLQSYAAQLDYYRDRVFELESGIDSCPVGREGIAALQAPAVFQTIETESVGPFVREKILEEGALINISAEVRPGKGRVLVQTTPLMGVVFQDAANTAVFVAESRAGTSLIGSDTIFSITAKDEVPAVDGASAGALMTLLVLAALNETELNESVTLTGTIDSEGNVGPIGGVVEKAQAAKEGGKKLLLLPAENNQIVRYRLISRDFNGFTITERKPEVLDTKEFIEENVGIKVEYVTSIEDILLYAA